MRLEQYCQQRFIPLSEEEKNIILLFTIKGLSASNIARSMMRNKVTVIYFLNPFARVKHYVDMRKWQHRNRDAVHRAEKRCRIKRHVCDVWKALEDTPKNIREQFIEDVKKDFAGEPLQSKST